VHWIYGVKFDLETIAKKCKSVGALLIIDGTQSVGAMPFDAQQIQPDALIVATYKWMMAPYSIGLAYFGEFFDDGVPVEETWMNRIDSEKFATLTRYERAYQPKAQRYNSGEFSNFIQMPMLETALRQLLDWGVLNIQNYCKSLIIKPLEALEKLGCRVESEEYRANHLFGIILPEHVNNAKLLEQLAAKKIYVSHRGKALRISPNVYNDEADLWALVEVLKNSLAI
jgi:selenocysteine lyase/cysteine desulfurase